MHKMAIRIKERILSPDDYEVSLSVGHLASLYSYDMRRYRDAEQLYFRSIRIGTKLFGPAYSGLEYDYRCCDAGSGAINLAVLLLARL